MDEYTIEVIIEGYQETIKSYSNSVYHVVDAMVNLSTVVSVSKITREKDQRVWDFNGDSLEPLRKLRSEAGNESRIQQELEKIIEV